ncbi:MAG TPA: hypothetical protein VFQ61_28620 [Polyangiaceae bacterium]|nr:hypothetical protein [Polyangiaceae bacterium]
MVNPDDLLTALGRVVRDREEVERERVSTAASAPPLTPSINAARVDTAHTHDSLVAAVLAELAKPAAPSKVDETPEVVPSTLAHSPSAPSVLASRRRLWVGLPTLAAAAALLFVLGRGKEQQPADLPALTPYSAELQGGIAAVRGGAKSDAPLKLAPGTELSLFLRPDAPVSGNVVAAVVLFARDSSSASRKLAVDQTVAASGALRLSVDLPNELPAHGDVCAVVAREQHLETGMSGVGASSGDGWQRFCWEFSTTARRQ